MPSDETKAKVSRALKGRPKPESWKQQVSQTLMGHSVSADTRQKLSVAIQRRWSDPEYIKSLCIGPNKAEMRLAKILEPFGFTFSGGGELIVKCKRPDFWDGKDRLVELYGDYWHRNDDPQDRINFMADNGYKCLVIWERELENPTDVTAKVSAFVGRHEVEA